MSVQASMAAPSSWEIVVRGRVGERLAAALGLQSEVIKDSQPPHCRLRGHVRDQTELVGIVNSLNDAGLQLLSVECQNLVNST